MRRVRWHSGTTVSERKHAHGTVEAMDREDLHSVQTVAPALLNLPSGHMLVMIVSGEEPTPGQNLPAAHKMHVRLSGPYRPAVVATTQTQGKYVVAQK